MNAQVSQERTEVAMQQQHKSDPEHSGHLLAIKLDRSEGLILLTGIAVALVAGLVMLPLTPIAILASRLRRKLKDNKKG